MDKTSVIFGNEIDKRTIKKANKSKTKFIKKFGDDSNKDYKLGLIDNKTLDFIGVKNIVFSDTNAKLPEKPIVIGNIRMGFGHYRISIALASCARALGYTPLWFDIASFDATGSKMIRYQNALYSKGSTWSSKSKLFNKVIWEPLNSEGFKKLTYNAADQKNAELFVPLYRNLPKDIPFVATHVWPSQGAIHAGLTHVVNAIPDNWPMGLHLSEGAIHTVQTPFAYLGYKKLNGFSKGELKPMPENSLYYVGNYVDHELVSNLEKDTAARLARLNNDKPLRFILTVGGAGAQFDIFKDIVDYLYPLIKEHKASLFINVGDHKGVLDLLIKKCSYLKDEAKAFIDDYDEFKVYLANFDKEDKGVTLICNKDIFEAVYSTNLLMRVADVLVTKPSELSFYPIPKLFIHRVGGHEAYGAIYSSNIGDGTFECDTTKAVHEMLDSMLNCKDILREMNANIIRNYHNGIYNGGYEVIKLATKKIN
jgi:hypothetical protein